MAGQAPSHLSGAQPRKDWGRVFSEAAGVLAQKRCFCTHRLRGIESGKARKEPNLVRFVPAAQGAVLEKRWETLPLFLLWWWW